MIAELRPHELQALQFLSTGPDQVGLIDSEEKLAAALTFIDLAKRGLVATSGAGEDTIYSLSPIGAAALRKWHDR